MQFYTILDLQVEITPGNMHPICICMMQSVEISLHLVAKDVLRLFFTIKMLLRSATLFVTYAAIIYPSRITCNHYSYLPAMLSFSGCTALKKKEILSQPSSTLSTLPTQWLHSLITAVILSCFFFSFSGASLLASWAYFLTARACERVTQIRTYRRTSWTLAGTVYTPRETTAHSGNTATFSGTI